MGPGVIVPPCPPLGGPGGLNPDYTIRVVAKITLVLLTTLLGDSQEDSLSLLIIKKISFLAKAVKVFIFCKVQIRGF